MQATSLFAMLLVAAATFSLNTSMPLGLDAYSGIPQGLFRLFLEGESYYSKVPPCLANVDKSKIFQYFMQYTSPKENATIYACLDYADYVIETNDGYEELTLENCTMFLDQYIPNFYSGLEIDCDRIGV